MRKSALCVQCYIHAAGPPGGAAKHYERIVVPVLLIALQKQKLSSRLIPQLLRSSDCCKSSTGTACNRTNPVHEWLWLLAAVCGAMEV